MIEWNSLLVFADTVAAEVATDSVTAPAATPDLTTALVAGLTIFVLAIFIGFEIITKIPPTLHTPLMSGSNAISGITLIGALLLADLKNPAVVTIVGALAIILATINVVGGFLVTHRMLGMFRRKS